MLCYVVLAMKHMPFLSSVCLIFTLWYCIKMAKHIIKILSPLDRTMILVFCILISVQNSDEITHNRRVKKLHDFGQ